MKKSYLLQLGMSCLVLFSLNSCTSSESDISSSDNIFTDTTAMDATTSDEPAVVSNEMDSNSEADNAAGYDYKVGTPTMSFVSPYELKQSSLDLTPEQKLAITDMVTMEYDNKNNSNYLHIMINYNAFADKITYNLDEGMKGAMSNMKANPNVSDMDFEITDGKYGGNLVSKTAKGSYKIGNVPLNFRMTLISNESAQWSIMAQNAQNEGRDAEVEGIFNTIEFVDIE